MKKLILLIVLCYLNTSFASGLIRACRTTVGPTASMKLCNPRRSVASKLCLYKSHNNNYKLKQNIVICYDGDKVSRDEVNKEMEEEVMCLLFDKKISCHKKVTRRKECPPGPLGPDVDHGISSLRKLGQGLYGF